MNLTNTLFFSSSINHRQARAAYFRGRHWSFVHVAVSRRWLSTFLQKYTTFPLFKIVGDALILNENNQTLSTTRLYVKSNTFAISSSLMEGSVSSEKVLESGRWPVRGREWGAWYAKVIWHWHCALLYKEIKTSAFVSWNLTQMNAIQSPDYYQIWNLLHSLSLHLLNKNMPLHHQIHGCTKLRFVPFLISCHRWIPFKHVYIWYIKYFYVLNLEDWQHLSQKNFKGSEF